MFLRECHPLGESFRENFPLKGDISGVVFEINRLWDITQSQIATPCQEALKLKRGRMMVSIWTVSPMLEMISFAGL